MQNSTNDDSFHFIGTDLWHKGLKDASWKCHIRVKAQKERGERDKEVM